MIRRLGALLLLATALVMVGPAAQADCPGSVGESTTQNGVVLGGACPSGGGDSGSHDPGSGGPWVPTGPPPPAYEDYWTPACSVNGPPNQGSDAMCMAAATICKTRGQQGDIFMRHYRRLVGSDDSGWKFVGTGCRGADDPVQQQPQVTQEMVLDQAYAAAPRPTANVQPGNRTFVNLPNNYFADAPDETRTVNVLGNPITVRFTVAQITWDFGDGQSATGKGIRDADIGAPGAVEHAYGQQGSYTIVANSSVSVQFTLPNGRAVNLPGVFSFDSAPVVLPVGEVQTRVDSTN